MAKHASTRALELVLVFALAWLWLSLVGAAPLHPDTSREFCFGLDVATGAEFHRHGPWASLRGFEQGTAWIDLLGLGARLGLGVVGIGRLVVTLLALAVLASYIGIAQLLAGELAKPGERSLAVRLAPAAGATTLLLSIPATTEMPALWLPLLLPPAAVLWQLSACRVLDRGELVDAVALGLLSGLATDIHIVGIVLACGPLLVVPLAARKPVVATLASVAAAIAYVSVSSPEMLAGNVEAVIQRGWLGLGLAAAIMTVVIGVALRARASRLGMRPKLELFVGFEILSIAALMLGSALDSDVRFAPRYLLPFAPGLGLGVALLISHRGGSSRRTAAMLAVLGAGLIVASPGRTGTHERKLPRDPRYTVLDTEALGTQLAARGHSWTELAVRLQGPEQRLLLGELARHLPAGPVPARSADRGLLVVSFESSRAERLLDQLPPETLAIEQGALTMLVIDTTARLDRYGVEACTEAGECTGVELSAGRRVMQAHPNAWILDQPVDQWFGAQSEGEGEVERVSWRFPIRGGPATVVVWPPTCAWELIDSEGLDVAGNVWGFELAADVEGSVTLARALDGHCPEPGLHFPPTPMELDPAWTGLIEALTGQRAKP